MLSNVDVHGYMQIRPVYWLLLLLCCLSTLGFACICQEHVPAQFRVQVIPQERAGDVMVMMHLTDPQEDLPLEDAQVMVNATMPAMTMPQLLVQVVRHAEAGCYKVLLTLPMTGQWLLISSAKVSNFITSPQRQLVNIPPATIPRVASSRAIC